MCYILSTCRDREYQDCFTSEMVDALADCLMDDTLIEIVKGLKDIQGLSESQLFQRRTDLCRSLEGNVYNDFLSIIIGAS